MKRSIREILGWGLTEKEKCEAAGRGFAKEIMENHARSERLEQMILMLYDNICLGVETRLFYTTDDEYGLCEDILKKVEQLKGKEKK